MLWSQPQFRLHGPSLRSTNFNNFELFNDEDVEIIRIQNLQNMEVSIDVASEKSQNDTTRKKIGKKKRGRALVSKYKNKNKNKWCGVGRFIK